MNNVITGQPLVSTTWLAEHVADSNLHVIEVDVSATTYNTGHIPGALLWNVYKDLLQPDYRIIERDRFAQLLANSGIAPDERVVVYGYAAAMAFWMMEYYGHRHVSFLDGSRAKWTSEARSLAAEITRVTPSRYAVKDLSQVRDHIRATHVEVQESLGDPNHQFMDVRSAAEYTGERFWPSLPPEGDQRGGHLPGAVLMPIEVTWSSDGSFKPVAELQTLYQARGFTPDKEIITYCAVGGRASQAWFVLTRLLGYPRVRVYDGSWVEWGTLPGVPVETSPPNAVAAARDGTPSL